MKIIEDQHAEIWRQGTGLDGMYKQIERTARVCYQSNDLIKEKSYVPIVKALIDKNHTSMLEHGTIYLERRLPDPSYFRNDNEYFKEKTRNTHREYSGSSAHVLEFTAYRRM